MGGWSREEGLRVGEGSAFLRSRLYLILVSMDFLWAVTLYVVCTDDTVVLCIANSCWVVSECNFLRYGGLFNSRSDLPYLTIFTKPYITP